jgi:uncharacterized Tic20 family protein
MDGTGYNFQTYTSKESEQKIQSSLKQNKSFVMQFILHPLPCMCTPNTSLNDPLFTARRQKNNRKVLKGKSKLLNVVMSTALMALPVLIGLKLKFFMLLSLGIAALSLVSGKAFILSMVSFVLAIVALLKKATHTGYSLRRADDFSQYAPYASRKSLEDMYSGGRAHKNYFM